ncbi:MAG: signal peptidase I [Pseudomonadota bacterium]
MAFPFKFWRKDSSQGVEGQALPDHTKMTPAEELWDLAKTVGYAVAIALVLRIVIFQPFNIPSGSMKPNLLVGDFLVVSKPTYGYSRASLVYPFTRIDMDGRLFGGEPKRGDIVVFKNELDGNKDYIKRVIGLPGDEIRMIGGHLHINGAAVQKDFVEVADVSCDGRPSQAPAYEETLDNGVSYRVYECHGDNGRLDNVGPYKVPAEHYFMMGDSFSRLLAQAPMPRPPWWIWAPLPKVNSQAVQ